MNGPLPAPRLEVELSGGSMGPHGTANPELGHVDPPNLAPSTHLQTWETRTRGRMGMVINLSRWV